ncbi:hypothetical protein Lal_00033893 [Lupinus albus]|nr:hypothetical protein Lal_00033893 [Lupinus albus]
MNTIKHQQKEYSSLTGKKVTSTASNSLLGFNDPYYAHEAQMTRLARFVGRGITPTAYTSLSWMIEFGYMFLEFFKNQGLHVCVELHGKMYPSLIREFYNNLQCKNGVYQTMVKDRFIILDEDLLVDVGGLARFDHPYGYFEEKWMSAFERVKVYRSMLRDSKRLTYTLLAYCWVPRDAHHDEPTEVDMYLMFSLKENLRIDCPQLILLNMLAFSTSSGALGYPILISRIIEHVLVDLLDTEFLNTNPQQHFILGQFIHHHLDIYKYDDVWTKWLLILEGYLLSKKTYSFSYN